MKDEYEAEVKAFFMDHPERLPHCRYDTFRGTIMDTQTAILWIEWQVEHWLMTPQQAESLRAKIREMAVTADANVEFK